MSSRPSAEVRVWMVAVALAAGSALHALPFDAIQNGSFEQPLPPDWTPLGAGISLTSTSDAHAGAAALRVTQRAAESDGPKQNLLAVLSAAGPGRFVTRFWIKPDDAVSVRARLLLTDATGTRTVILAERVVRDSGAWRLVEGSVPLAWSGTLLQAIFRFDVDRRFEAIFPSYTVDEVSMQWDDDGDRLANETEDALGTDSASFDSDGDGLDDGWESDHVRDPLLWSGTADGDGDGFSDREEYFAATDPGHEESRPGTPSNAAASPAARELLRSLALLPSGGCRRVIVGQHIAGSNGLETGYDDFIVGLEQATGRWPALMSGLYDSQPGPLDIAGMNPIALEWWNQGGLVLIKWSPFNPWTGNDYRDHTGVDIPQLLVEGHPAHDVWMDWLDQIAAGLAELRDAGVVVLWRPMSEMTGGWFWWGRQPRLDYVDLWRQMHQYFSVDKGLDNLIWVYESAQTEHAVVASDYYYPGDDVVDVMSHNLYDDDWVLPWDLDQIFRRYPKVYGVPQAGPDDVRDGSWSAMVMIDAIRDRFPRASFFSAWSSFFSSGVDHKLAIVDNQGAADLMHDPWIVTRERLAGRGGRFFGDDLESGDLCAWSAPPPP